MILVYVTCRDKKEAKGISDYLLEKGLVGCSNFFPVNSAYVWNKKRVNDNEYVVILKTLNKNYNEIKREIKKIHSYDVPFIGKLNIDVNKEYERYLKREVR